VKCEKHETKNSPNFGNETETLLSCLKVEYEQLTSDKNMTVTLSSWHQTRTWLLPTNCNR